MHNYFGQRSTNSFTPPVSLNPEVTAEKGGKKRKDTKNLLEYLRVSISFVINNTNYQCYHAVLVKITSGFVPVMTRLTNTCKAMYVFWYTKTNVGKSTVSALQTENLLAV